MPGVGNSFFSGHPAPCSLPHPCPDLCHVSGVHPGIGMASITLSQVWNLRISRMFSIGFRQIRAIRPFAKFVLKNRPVGNYTSRAGRLSNRKAVVEQTSKERPCGRMRVGHCQDSQRMVWAAFINPGVRDHEFGKPGRAPSGFEVSWSESFVGMTCLHIFFPDLMMILKIFSDCNLWSYPGYFLAFFPPPPISHLFPLITFGHLARFLE